MLNQQISELSRDFLNSLHSRSNVLRYLIGLPPRKNLQLTDLSVQEIP